MTSKIICSKHEQAYPKDEGCPYCEPPARVPGDSILRFPEFFVTLALDEIKAGESVFLTPFGVKTSKVKVM